MHAFCRSRTYSTILLEIGAKKQSATMIGNVPHTQQNKTTKPTNNRLGEYPNYTCNPPPKKSQQD